MICNDLESRLKPLWIKARAGDETAYRAALQAIAQMLRTYFRRRLKDSPYDVEDLVQETLLALHVRRETHDPSLPLTNWVYAIARYKLADLWRRHGRGDALHEPLDDDIQILDPSQDAELEPRRDLADLLNHLPGQQRDAIVMTRIEGLSMAEASARTGVSASALKLRVHRGLKRLSGMVRDMR